MKYQRREADRIGSNGVVAATFCDAVLEEHNLCSIAESVHVIRAREGETIIQEFTPAEYYYILASGTAEMYHSDDGETATLAAELKKGDTFGEAGMITGTHQATVTMRSNGVLLQLDRECFNKHLSMPLLKEINIAAAKGYLSQGYHLLDVRYDFELELFGQIDNSLHIPLHMLKRRRLELDSDKKYIVFCKSGNRSQVGAVLLAQLGIDAYSMQGGFTGWQAFHG